METSELGDDLLVGAVEIAKFLRWRSKNGKEWNVRRIYHCAEGALPIHKQEGLGLVARKSTLLLHFNELDQRHKKQDLN